MKNQAKQILEYISNRLEKTRPCIKKLFEIYKDFHRYLGDTLLEEWEKLAKYYPNSPQLNNLKQSLEKLRNNQQPINNREKSIKICQELLNLI